MPIQKALHAYTEERLNCAQSILRAFQEEYGLTEDAIGQARAFGGGRADEGLCGALYAALLLAKTEEEKLRLREEFRRTAGALTCHDIKRQTGYPCRDCVTLAAELLHKK